MALVQMLLSEGAMIIEADYEGRTPFFLKKKTAAENGHLEVAMVLLEAGAAVGQAKDMIIEMHRDANLDLTSMIPHTQT